MPEFRYRALRESGGEVEGRLVAVDAREAAARLQAIGNFPIEVTALSPGRVARLRARGGIRLSSRELALFTGQLATLIGAGVALPRALALIAGEHGRRRRARLAEALLAAVNRGESLSRACAGERALAGPYAMVVAAGEAQGDISAALDRLAQVIERDRAIGQSLFNALIYPASVFVVACLSIAFLLDFVVPRFAGLLTGFRHAPPLAMRLLLAAAAGFHAYGAWAALLLLAALGLILLGRRDPGFRLSLDRRLLALPGIGSLIAKVETERLAFLLGNLVAAGVALPAALAATRAALGNAALRAGLAAAEQGVERGDRLAAALGANGLLPEMALELVRVGEETGDLAPMLLRAGDILRSEFEATSARLIGLVTPLSMIALGLLIGAVALALFGTVMDVYDIAT